MTGDRQLDHLGDVHGAGAAALADPADTHAPDRVVVHARELRKNYGPVEAVRGIELDVHQGEIFGLIGPDGAGKTTTFQILAGIMEATSGVVEVFGKPARESRAAVGYLTQTFSLYPDLSVNENIRYVGDLRHVRPNEIAERGERYLQMFDMHRFTDRLAGQLSGGMKQKLSLVCALVAQPRVLLLDEPLSALDAKVRLQLREQIRTLQQRLGTTTLFVTHDQQEALSMADRIGVMKDGRLEQIATPSELYSTPATAFVAEFVGTMNRLPGTYRGGDEVTVLGLDVPVHGDHPNVAAGEADVLVRPEGLTVEAVAGGNGIVTDRTFLGSLTRVSVLLSGDVAVKVDKSSTAAADLTPGTSVQVGVIPGGPVLIAEPRR